MDNDRIELNGYSFTRDMGLEAKREQTAIEYLSKQLNMDEPSTVMKVYRQIISQKLFHTQVGYEFLKGLQNYLITNPEIDNSTIETIEIDSPEEVIDAINASKAKRGESSKRHKKNFMSPKEGIKYKKRSSIFMVTTVILAATVVAMLIIAALPTSMTLFNYREKLNDYYAEWEQSLTERERALSGNDTPLQFENVVEGNNNTD